MARGEWEVYVANEVRDWLDTLDATTHFRVVQAIDTLADSGPGLGRSILLVAGDKAGQWSTWYLQAIPLAEQRYERYLKERTQEEEQR